MKTIFNHLRDRLLPPPQPLINLQELERSQWSQAFERFMRNRMIMGGLRYGRLDDPKLPRRDMIGSIISRAQKYRNDGNQEHLVDIANLAMVEFCRPSHPNPKWAPVDDGEHVRNL